MSTIALDRLPPEVREHPPLVMTMDDRRGTGGMWLFIATEGFLFVMFFVAYFYLAQGGWNWPGEKPPDVKLAIPMLFVLLASSGVLHWGEKEVKKREYGRGQAAILMTLLLAAGFLVLSFFDYQHHLKEVGPTTNSYGSIFYTIVSFHLAHLVVGMLMLGYVFILPAREPADRPPHRAYHNASLYWHFVDFIWIWIVVILYLSPHVR
jgi:heme/copper-type cytochrome/quinol oxidase subunit 3